VRMSLAWPPAPPRGWWIMIGSGDRLCCACLRRSIEQGKKPHAGANPTLQSEHFRLDWLIGVKNRTVG